MNVCPVCHVKPLEELDGLSRCACDHIFQSTLEVTAHYDKDYITKRYDSYPTTEAMSYLRLGYLRGFCPKGKLLDVGYGNGSFVKAAIKAEYDAYGYDVHHANYGVRETPIISHDHWDVVTFFDSLEHFPDFKEVCQLARRAKWILVSFPCRPSWFPYKREWRHYRPGEHLHYFTLCSLATLFYTHTMYTCSDLEDSIRGKLPDGEQNIQTAVLKGK